MSYEEIRNLPLLSPEEERIASRDDLIIFNSKLAYSRAKRWDGQGVPFDDLEQEAMVGLIKAADKFDPDRGVKFATHATPWIDNELRRCVQKAKTVRLPIYLQQEADKNMVHPSFKEAGTSEDEGVLDPEDRDSLRPDEQVELNRWREQVQGRLEVLSPRERTVLGLYYGLEDAPMTVTAIAMELGLSPGRITQIRKGAEEKLRKG